MYLICISILFAFYCAHFQWVTYYFKYLLHFCLVVTKLVVCLQCRNNQTLVLYSTNEKKGIVYLCVIYPYGTIMLTQTKMRLCRNGRGMPNSLTYWNYFYTYLINEKRVRIKILRWHCYAIERTCEPMGVDAYG